MSEATMDAEVAIGTLCWAGDTKCECGDVAALSEIARRLLELVHEPVHCELVPLADACADPDRAVAAWTELRDRVLGRGRGAPS
jgi:hypothetical protein